MDPEETPRGGGKLRGCRTPTLVLSCLPVGECDGIPASQAWEGERRALPEAPVVRAPDPSAFASRGPGALTLQTPDSSARSAAGQLGEPTAPATILPSPALPLAPPLLLAVSPAAPSTPRAHGNAPLGSRVFPAAGSSPSTTAEISDLLPPPLCTHCAGSSAGGAEAGHPRGTSS